MWLLTWKNLVQERGRVAMSAGGVAVALVLILLMNAIFAGAARQLAAYIEETDADVWVMQQGVSNMHMATSVMPAELGQALAGVSGVAEADAILYVNAMIEASGRRSFSYIVGVPRESARGGPREVAAGKSVPAPGEAILPEILGRRDGAGIGSAVTILGRELQVSGLSVGTFAMANSVTFVAYEDLRELLSAPDSVSYFLVTAEPGVPAALLAERIRTEIPGVNAMTREAFAESDRAMAMQMGVDIIGVMSLVGLAVGMLVIALTMYTSVVRQAREYGVAMALGARSRQLVTVVVAQALVIALLGLAAALALAVAARPLIHSLVPEVVLEFAPGSILTVTAAALGIALLSAILPAARVSRTDPAMVFKE